MRIFEVLLIAVSIWAIYNVNKGTKRMLISSGIGLALMLIHFLAEGMRWQVAFIYTFLAISFISSLIMSITNYKINIKHRWISAATKGFILLLVVISSVLAYVFPVFKLPLPRGEHSVGTVVYQFEDTSRKEKYTDNENDYRKLMIQIWYPCDETDNKAYDYYISDAEYLGKAIAKDLGIPSIIISHLDLIKSNSIYGAPVADTGTQYPLIVFSHGLGTFRSLYTTYLEELASHGYIVAAVDHTYSTMATVFNDNSVTGFKLDLDNLSRKDSEQLGDYWLEDIDFVIKQIEIKNNGIDDPMFKNKIDMSSIGVFGHSFGGAVAYRALFIDERIKAAIDLDGSLHGEFGYDINNKSFMLMTSEEHAEAIKKSNEVSAYEELGEKELENLKALNITKEKYDEEVNAAKKARNEIKRLIDNGGYFISIKGTGHYNFSDAGMFSPLTRVLGLTGKINNKKSMEIVENYIVAFLNANLKIKKTQIFDIQTKKYEEVHFEGLE